MKRMEEETNTRKKRKGCRDKSRKDEGGKHEEEGGDQ